MRTLPLLLLLLPALAGAVDVQATWIAPTSGGPVEDYLLEVSTDGGPFVAMATTTELSVLLDLPLYSICVARVAGRNQEGQGPWSGDSDPYYVTLGPPGQPGEINLGTQPVPKPRPRANKHVKGER